MGMQLLEREVYDALVLRAWSDEAFSRFLDENPKAAIAEMGQRFDDIGDLRVIRDTAKVKYLLIPETTKQASAERETNAVEPDVTTTRGVEAAAEHEAFLAKLESNPRVALEEAGQPVPEDIELVVVRDRETLRHVHIPFAPANEGEVSDEELLAAQGGVPWLSIGVGATVAGWVITVTVAAGGTFD